MASRNVSSITKCHSHTNPPRTCMCSPTNHPGSFRCAKHKKQPARAVVGQPSSFNDNHHHHHHQHHYHHHHRESSTTMTKANDSLKAILLQIIKHPSGHYLHRRKNFQPKPTRFCVMNHVEVS